ncbi:MAG: tRNA (N(6)-L-threonylcarbamoyladenosine(37)-C(2))-methylthiotransferase MtaB [Nitrospiraceae bacterium]
MSSAPRASLHTLGCRLNQAETALLADRLRQDGYHLVEFGQPTDLLVVNTCSVTESAEKDCRYAVRRTLRHSPGAFVAVTGCYAQTGAASLRQVPGIDMVVGTRYKMHLPDYLPAPDALAKQPSARVLHTKTIEREDFELAGCGESTSTRAPLKVQDGCNFMCSFCLIPFARGHERSRRLYDAVREAQELADRGHRELILTGVNVGQYRHGQDGLLELILRLEQIRGLDRIRISSIEPTTISDSLLNHMATSSKLCRYLHIPLQSGDDTVLRAMNRRYSVKEYVALIDKAISKIPDLGLGTDLLVGFPGEGEEQFGNTMRLATEIPFSYFHVFSYSQRPGTASARIGHAINRATVRSRVRLLAELSRAKRMTFYQFHIGRTVEVLFENERRQGLQTGLTSNFIKVGVPSRSDLARTAEKVLITGAMDGLAVGHLSAPMDQVVRGAHD